MMLSGLALQHLRTHAQFFLKFEQPVVLIIGPNASGKTTLIEAIHLLSSGESFRAGKIDELIQFGAELARVKGKIDQDEVEVIITPGEVQGKRTSKRLYSVNGVRRQKKAATSFFSTVVFRPEDMRLIEGSPARRRSFLDTPLSHLSSEYARSLHTYEQTLLRRNKLLQQVREREQPATTLQFWNLSLVKHGELVQHWRQVMLQHLTSVSFPVNFSVTYVPSIISEARLKEYGPREIAAGHTLIGPHKDDFVVHLTKPARVAGRDAVQLQTLNAADYGSRGEQRLAVLWLKFGELSYIEQQTGKKPILLLDDILSELDSDSQRLALSVLPHYQSVVTTIDPELEQVVRAAAPDLQVLTLAGLPD